MPSIPTDSSSPADDTPPVAVADAFNLSAQQASLVSHVVLHYPDHPEWDTDDLVYGTLLNVTANDTDVNPNDAGHFWIYDYTQPVDANGNQVGSLTMGNAPDGQLRFYNPNADDTVSQDLTFTYQIRDQWGAGGSPNSVSAPITVTIHIAGNAVAGQTMTGGNHPQALTGGAGNDKLFGGNQDDTLSGMGGSDTLSGDNGKDLLLGGDGKDSLTGGNGDDTLNGGSGDDTMSGGNGGDRFVFNYGFGHDTITDFDTKNDRIVVGPNIWGGFDDVKAHAVQVGTSVVLTSDFDGFTLTLQNVKLSALTASDFLFV